MTFHIWCIILAGVTVGLPCGNAIFSVHEEFPRLRHRLGARVPRIFGWYPWKRVPRIEWFSCYLVFLYTSNSLKRHPFENPSHIHVFGIFTCIWFIFYSKCRYTYHPWILKISESNDGFNWDWFQIFTNWEWMGPWEVSRLMVACDIDSIPGNQNFPAQRAVSFTGFSNPLPPLKKKKNMEKKSNATHLSKSDIWIQSLDRFNFLNNAFLGWTDNIKGDL